MEFKTFNDLIQKGDLDGCKEFMKTHPSFCYETFLPLHNAIWYGKSILLTFFLEQIKRTDSFSEELNRYDGSGLTPLYMASAKGDFILCKILLHYEGIDINKKEKHYRMTPFHIACYNNYIEIVDLLMQREVDMFTRDVFDHSPIYDLNRKDNEQLLAYLIQYQKRKEELRALPEFITEKDIGKLVILGDYHLCERTIEKNPELLMAKTEEGIPFYLMFEYNHPHLLEVFKKHIPKAMFHQKDSDGNTPLHYACKSGSEILCTLLIEQYHTNIETTNHLNQTPIIVASIYGHFNVCKYLKQKGANVYHKDTYGKTSLNYTFL